MRGRDLIVMVYQMVYRVADENAGVLFPSFSDMQGAVGPLRERGDHAGAIEILERYVDAFPLHRGHTLLTLAEVLADAGRDGDAIGALERALAAGCRYQREWLTMNPRSRVSLPCRCSRISSAAPTTASPTMLRWRGRIS